MKKPKQETREAAMHVRLRPSVKAAAERLAQEYGRSLANWLERLIEAEAARHDGKSKGRGHTFGQPLRSSRRRLRSSE
jgi:hypothetical protein